MRQKDWKRKSTGRGTNSAKKNVSKKDWKQKERGSRKSTTEECRILQDKFIGDMILAKKNFASKLTIAIIAEIDHDDCNTLKVYFIDGPKSLDKTIDSFMVKSVTIHGLI